MTAARDGKEHGLQDNYASAGDCAKEAIRVQHQVAHQHVSELPDQDLLQRQVNRARSASRPKPPGKHDHSFKINEKYFPDGFYKGEVEAMNRGEKRRHLVFATNDQLRYLATIKKWYMYGTFEMIGLPFIQVLSIHGFLAMDDLDHPGDSIEMKSQPLFYAAMTRRKTVDYVAVLTRLMPLLRPTDFVPWPAVEKVMSDFERAMWLAVLKVVRTRAC